MERAEETIARELKVGAKVTGSVLKATGKPLAKYAFEQILRSYMRSKNGPGRRIL